MISQTKANVEHMEDKTSAKHKTDTVHSDLELGYSIQKENRLDSQKGRESTALREEVARSLGCS